MDISELMGAGAPPPNATPPSAMPNPLEEKIAALEAQVAGTKSKLDDMVVKQQRADLLSEYSGFKASIPDFDESAFFASLEEKYNGYVAEGATPEQAQALVDKVFQNPIGWRAVWGEIVQKSAPQTPDAIIPSVNGSNVEELPATRAGLGKFLNKQGAK
ncbi:MAG: hypothetical protein PHX44_01265 [Sulfurimonas sp.]|uniref:hypothetical protein n=1 Tax=Sulfurimonas sp. TaxID=2022749 RepID=UPI00262CBC0C|nr:hypothetical protein [Sulfurimonas sp.]MDD2651662.1 hypothetical protein [Sulfurimonas sp.]MDD3451473.1 hypothetical protein [Sulfurimonas sp.]